MVTYIDQSNSYYFNTFSNCKKEGSIKNKNLGITALALLILVNLAGCGANFYIF